MRLKIFFIILAMVVSFISNAAGEEVQKAENLVQTENLIKKEMAALDRAFKITIDSVVLNQSDKIVSAYDETNMIREQFEKSVKEGNKITLPKNPKMFKVFVKLDYRFHREVGALLEAAKKNRMWAVQRQTYRLLLSCIKCHNLFRK